MEELQFEIQHADFECTEQIPVSAEEGIRRIREHDWTEEFTRFVKLLDANRDCCPPGAFLRKADDSFLHIYRTASNEYRLLLTVPIRRKFLGLVPIRTWREARWEADNIEPLMAHVRDYATRPNDELVQTI